MNVHIRARMNVGYSILSSLLLIVEVTHEDMPATETDLSLTKPTHIMHHSIHMRRLAVKKYRVGQVHVHFPIIYPAWQ